MTIRKLILIATFTLGSMSAALAQWSGGPGYYGFGPGSSDAAGTNDNFVARNRGPFGPDGTGNNYEYYRSSGPDRGNSVESQR